MNEQQFSLQIRKALDETADHLPYKITHRLSAASELALSRMQAQPVGFAAMATAGTTQRNERELFGSTTLWRFAGTLVPALIIAAGIFAMQVWDISAKADELTEVDAEMLTDEVPIDTYADRGFGVFLKNTKQ